MSEKNIIFLVLFILAFGFLFYNMQRLIKSLLIGQKEYRFNNIPSRIKKVIIVVFAQSKLLRDPIAGPIHFFIFWGFMIFLLAVIESVIQGFYTHFTWQFLGYFYSIITVVQDIFAVLVIISVLFALYRRFIQKVERLKVGKKGAVDAIVILTLIFLVCVTMLGQNSSAIASNNFLLNEYEVRPVSLYLSNLIYSAPGGSADKFHEIFWWSHIIIIFGFMNFLPYSKHLHVYSSIPNVFFSKVGENVYSLKNINLEDESTEQYGAADVDHLSWKQLLDGYSCTECGRCVAVCPAANTGKLLSPRKIVTDIRKRTEEKAPWIIKNYSEAENYEKTLVHNYITDKELWACTTCNACVYECPVTIAHLDAIIDMRRNLVLMESDFPAELNPVFKNLETNFTPWAFNPHDRVAWADGMNIKTMAEDSNTDLLFWVGCAGSFDERYKKVTVATAKLFQKANIDFRILGAEEKCNGDTARRLGNEYLSQILMRENIETLNNYNVKKIVTACPHCYNSLKNEYPQFGGNFEVIHHSQLINELLHQGRIQLKDNINTIEITFHDSCYLGRYNNIYDEPRALMKRIKNLKVVEMSRNKDKGFCCGAGGGRMFLEETEGKRINENRTEEAIKTNAKTIASACPFCMTMITDGLKTFDKIEEIKVKDIAEVILENSI